MEDLKPLIVPLRVQSKGLTVKERNCKLLFPILISALPASVIDNDEWRMMNNDIG